MHVRTALLLTVLALVALFAALNWSTFTAPTELWVGFTTFQAPLGVIMLGVVVFLCVMFVAWVIWLQGTVLFETRRHARELAVQRELADKAEASRFTELRAFITDELGKSARASDAARAGTLVRFDEMEQRHRVALEQTVNSVAAAIGALEDRLARRLEAGPVRSPEAEKLP